jgi:hypothetical protein
MAAGGEISIGFCGIWPVARVAWRDVFEPHAFLSFMQSEPWPGQLQQSQQESMKSQPAKFRAVADFTDRSSGHFTPISPKWQRYRALKLFSIARCWLLHSRAAFGIGLPFARSSRATLLKDAGVAQG